MRSGAQAGIVLALTSCAGLTCQEVCAIMRLGADLVSGHTLAPERTSESCEHNMCTKMGGSEAG